MAEVGVYGVRLNLFLCSFSFHSTTWEARHDKTAHIFVLGAISAVPVANGSAYGEGKADVALSY